MLHITDGRAFSSRTDKKYDLILFALPDSLTLVSWASRRSGWRAISSRARGDRTGARPPQARWRVQQCTTTIARTVAGRPADSVRSTRASATKPCVFSSPSLRTHSRPPVMAIGKGGAVRLRGRRRPRQARGTQALFAKKTTTNHSCTSRSRLTSRRLYLVTLGGRSCSCRSRRSRSRTARRQFRGMGSQLRTPSSWARRFCCSRPRTSSSSRCCSARRGSSTRSCSRACW